MRTEYVSLHAAIEWFEDFMDDTLRSMIKSAGDKHIHWQYANRMPSKLKNFLYYLENEKLELELDCLYIKCDLDVINKIGLYGKKTPEITLEKISPKIIELIDFRIYKNLPIDTNFFSKKKYIIASSYTYTERYVPEFNYAVLSGFGGKIFYFDLCVKYDEYLELMQKLNKYVNAIVKKNRK